VGAAVSGFSELSPIDRARRYRELAVEAQHRAVMAATGDGRKVYLLIAARWLELASDIEVRHPGGLG
jgi:hypothetical protein